MSFTIDDVKKLREETGAGVMDAKKALEEYGDYAQAKQAMVEAGAAKAAKKSDRQAKDGLVFSYLHSTGKVGSLVESNCETDFVARTEDFKKLGQEVAMQAAAMPAANLDEFLAQDYIRDPSKKISDLVTGAIAKLGENIKIARIVRYKISEGE